MSSAPVLARGAIRYRLIRGGRSRRLVLVISTLIAAVVLAPLALVALDARSAGWHETSSVLFRQRSALLLRHTVVLTVLVTASAAVTGVGAAWCTERCALPARRVWSVLLALPVAMPDFISGYAWHSIDPRMNPLFAATVVMTLGTYPLIFLPVSAALRRTDEVLEDTAHSLGVGAVETFVRISLPAISPALLGGGVLVALTVLSEYGTFEILRYSTFTTEIFTEFKFNPSAAGALSIPLILLGLLALCGDATLSRHRGSARVQAHRPIRRERRFSVSASLTAALLALVGLGVGVPLASVCYWIRQSQYSTLPAVATVGQACVNTVRYSALGALSAVVAALPVAMMSFRRRTSTRAAIERSTLIIQAVPGLVVALSLVFFAAHYAFGLYQTSALLVLAYAIIHFPLALVCVKTSVAQAPAKLADIGASLGAGRVRVFTTVILPLLAPGLIVGFCLVFLTAVTELTATLLLAPIGVKTLATQFWAYQSEVAYGAAAPYALVIVALAVVPGTVLGLWFDRDARPAGATVVPS